jgi:hypothetical protein
MYQKYYFPLVSLIIYSNTMTNAYKEAQMHFDNIKLVDIIVFIGDYQLNLTLPR